ncbi:MAG TPA: GDSL-type esterase/lipase family protein [Alphaproteobacteria bacterium]|nr:GDSL-type esterase/lipase family protein [Alphaproteobacteria bacterium]
MPRHRARLFLRAIAIVYLIILHLGIAAFILSPEFRAAIAWRLPGAARERQEAYWRGMVAAEARLDATLPPGKIYFIGDSGIESLDVGQVAEHAVNYGIGGDTIAGVIRRLPVYKSLPSAQAIVLLVGSNDLIGRPSAEAGKDYANLLAALPNAPLIAVAVLPIDERIARCERGHRSNAEIASLDKVIKSLCQTRPSCAFLDLGSKLVDESGNLAATFDWGDGLHLNAAGYRIAIDALRAEIARRVGQ